MTPKRLHELRYHGVSTCLCGFCGTFRVLQERAVVLVPLLIATVSGRTLLVGHASGDLRSLVLRRPSAGRVNAHNGASRSAPNLHLSAFSTTLPSPGLPAGQSPVGPYRDGRRVRANDSGTCYSCPYTNSIYPAPGPGCCAPSSWYFLGREKTNVGTLPK